MDSNVAFSLLQPSSVTVAKKGDVSSVKRLKDDIQRVIAKEEKEGGDGWTSCINDLKEYLLFPVILLLKKGKCSWSLLDEIVGVIKVVVEKSCVEDFSLFTEIFTQLFLLLSDPSDPQKLRAVSEECKEITLGAVAALVDTCGREVWMKVYGPDFRAQLGHAVYLCLKILQEEKNRSLRAQAMETVLSLGQKRRYDSLTGAEQDTLSDTFVYFLPGLVLALTKVATADETQGHRLTALAIDTWSYFVTLVMRDSFVGQRDPGLGESEAMAQLRNQLAPSKGAQPGNTPPQPEEQGPPSKLARVEVTGAWVKQTRERLMLLVPSIASLATHTHWAVRFALTQWAQHLVCTCCRSLPGSVVAAVEVVVVLRSDEMEDVGTAAHEALLAITRALEASRSHTPSRQGLVELLEERVYALATQLPTTCRRHDDRQSLTSVRQLVGCLEVLGERLTQLMMSPAHAHRLLHALTFTLSMDTSDSDLLLESTGMQDPFELVSIKPSLGQWFRYFRDGRVAEVVGAGCQLLGYHGSLVVAADHCLDLLQRSTHQQAEVMMLLAMIIRGRDRRKVIEKDSTNISMKENKQVTKNILEVIMCPEIFSAELYITAPPDTGQGEKCQSSLVPINRSTTVSVERVKNNVVLVACALNLISACGHMVGKDFEVFLSSVLCSVMEKAGETNALVGHTANRTLRELAEACGHKGVAEFIKNSVPHFWYTLSMRLKRLPQYPSAPLVLQVALHYANIDVMAFTEDLVEDVLSCLDAYHQDQAVPLLRVLLVYVTSVSKFAENRYQEKGDNEGNDRGMKHCGGNEEAASPTVVPGDSTLKSNTIITASVTEFLQKYHSEKLKIREGLSEQCSEEDTEVNNKNEVKNDDDLMETIDEDKSKESPQHIKLVVEILDRCSNMLYLEDRKSKLVILEVVKAGCQALQHWENERLPALHNLWKPLVLRLKDRDFVVLLRALEVLLVMVSTSGEFLRRRTLTEVFPHLLSFLKTQSEASAGKTRHSGYYMTAAYRAQCVLLRELPRLLDSMVLGMKHVAELVEAVVRYADQRQPPELCHAAVSLLQRVADGQRHHVWLALAHHQQQAVRVIPPHPDLSEVKIQGSGSHDLPPEVLDLYHQLS